MGGKGSGRKPTQRKQAHGAVARYAGGCRCAPCRAAWRDYMRARRGSAPRVRREPRPSRGRGARSYFDGKVPDALSVLLTPLGRRILAAATARTRKTRGDVFEHLLRLHGAEVRFAEQEGTAA